MGAWCVKNNKGQEVICECCSKPFNFLEAVLESEYKGFLPKGLYSSEEIVKERNGWCNTCSNGYYQVPRLEGVIVPNGTFEKLGINYQGEPIELK